MGKLHGLKMCELKVPEGTNISSVTCHGVVDRERQRQQRMVGSTGRHGSGRQEPRREGGSGQRGPTAAPQVPWGQDEPLTASTDNPSIGNRLRSLSLPSASFKRGAGSSGKLQVFLPQACGSPPARGCASLLAVDKGGYIWGRGASSSSFQSRAQTAQLHDLWGLWGAWGSSLLPAGQAAYLLGRWAQWTGHSTSCWTVMPLPPQLPTLCFSLGKSWSGCRRRRTPLSRARLEQVVREPPGVHVAVTKTVLPCTALSPVSG